MDQSNLPGTKPLFSPRVGFNWNAAGDRNTQVRGGTGIFTGRVPFVWVGNVISNPGANPNLFPAGPRSATTGDSTTLAQSFDLNAMVPDFKWPQVWTTDLAIDQQLGRGFLGTLEVIYGKDINNVFVRNADLVAPVRTLPDGRPYFGGAGANELNPDGGAGIYVIDNTSEGHNFNVTAQLRKTFEFGLSASVGLQLHRGQEQPQVHRDRERALAEPAGAGRSQQAGAQLLRVRPAAPDRGQRHVRQAVVGAVPHLHRSLRRGGRGQPLRGRGRQPLLVHLFRRRERRRPGGNDLIYIPRDQSEIILVDCPSDCGANVTPQQQWDALNAFIEQDKYLSQHRGEIAERFGAVNPWYSNVDLRILQDIAFGEATRHNFQLSFDMLNVGNLISSDWGVRKVASSAATSPLRLATDTGGSAVRRQRRADAPVHRAGRDLHRRSQHQFAVEGAARVEVLLRVVVSPLSP